MAMELDCSKCRCALRSARNHWRIYFYQFYRPGGSESIFGTPTGGDLGFSLISGQQLANEEKLFAGN